MMSPVRQIRQNTPFIIQLGGYLREIRKEPQKYKRGSPGVTDRQGRLTFRRPNRLHESQTWMASTKLAHKFIFAFPITSKIYSRSSQHWRATKQRSKTVKTHGRSHVGRSHQITNKNTNWKKTPHGQESAAVQPLMKRRLLETKLE